MGTINILSQERAALLFEHFPQVVMGDGKMILGSTSVDPNMGHNFTGKAQDSAVSFSAFSLLEPYITLELRN